MSSSASPEVLQWRTARAIAQGFGEEDATVIAADVLIVGETREEDSGIDLHLVDRLLEAGCPHELARRIV